MKMGGNRAMRWFSSTATVLALTTCVTRAWGYPGSPDFTFNRGGSFEYREGDSTKLVGVDTDDQGNLAMASVVVRNQPNFEKDWVVTRFDPRGVVAGVDRHRMNRDADAFVLLEGGRSVMATSGPAVIELLLLNFPEYGNAPREITTPVQLEGPAGVNALTTDHRGRFLVAGYAYGSSLDVMLVRYLADGTLDREFGYFDGFMFADFGFSEAAEAVAVDDLERIVVVGHSLRENDSELVVLRYLDDGSPDPSFGSGGRVSVRPSGSRDSYATSLALGKEGRIFLGTRLFDHDGVEGGAVARFSQNGSLEATWGPIGVQIDAVAADEMGRILYAGKGDSGGFISRLLPSGHIDFSFGAPLIVFTDDDAVRSLAVDGQGRFVSGGVREEYDPDELLGLHEYSVVRRFFSDDPEDLCVDVGGDRAFFDRSAKLVMKKVNTDVTPGNDSFTLSGSFQMPAGWSFADFDPTRPDGEHGSGVTVQIAEAADLPLVTAILSGTYGSGGASGWARRGRAWTYVDRGSDPAAQGVYKAKLTDLGGGRIKVSISARNGTYARITHTQISLQTTVTLGRLGGASLRGECGEASFGSAECKLNGSGNAVTCRG